MRCYPDKLKPQLSKGLSPVYLVYGDEPLQVQECCDLIRVAARTAGYATREVISIEQDSDWRDLADAGNSMSLFAEQRLLDLRLPSGKPGRAGGEALREYCARPADDAILLIGAGKIDGASTRSAWFKAIDKIGVTVGVWPLQGNELMGWIDRRLKAVKLQADKDAVRLIAERVEGNMLAAKQEIDKLVLLVDSPKVTADTVLSAVVDSSRYSVFDLTGAMLAGDARRVVHIIDVLRGEGVEAAPTLWAIQREVRELGLAASAVSRGVPPNQALSEAGVAPFRHKTMQPVLRRFRPAQWGAVLNRCNELDLMVKGRSKGNVWDELTDVCLAVAGKVIKLPRAS